MFFKIKLFEEYRELCGVIGADGLPYFILLHVAGFLNYKNPNSAIHGPVFKQYQKTVSDVIAPCTTVDCINGKRRVLAFQELLICMDRKRNFHDSNQFILRFKIGRLAEPIPDWTKPFDPLDDALVLRLDYTQLFNHCTGNAMTVEKWLKNYSETRLKMMDSPAIPHCPLPPFVQFRKQPLQAPPINVPKKRPIIIGNSDGNDPCVSSSMSPSSRTMRLNEHSITTTDLQRDAFSANGHSVSQNNPLLRELLNRPSSTNAFAPPPVPSMRNCVQNHESGLFVTPDTATATHTPTPAFTLSDNYMVQSPATVEPCSAPLPRYRPVPVNEEYLVEAPDSVRPYHRPAEEDANDRLPETAAASSTFSDELQLNRGSPMRPGYSFGESMTEKEQQRLTEIINAGDWMSSKKRCADTSFPNDGREECESDTCMDNAAFTVKQNRRKQTLPKRMAVDQDIELPKINLKIGEKTYTLGISLRLEEQV